MASFIKVECSIKKICLFQNLGNAVKRVCMVSGVWELVSIWEWQIVWPSIKCEVDTNGCQPISEADIQVLHPYPFSSF